MAIFVSRHSVSVREPHIVRYAGAVVGPVPPGAFLLGDTMPQHVKEGPSKYCEQCGKKMERKYYNGRREDFTRFMARRFCDLTCSGLSIRGIRVLNEQTSRARSAKFAKTECEQCGGNEYLQVHHKDHDPLNNDIRNLITLCMSCHVKAHHAEWLSKNANRTCEYCDSPVKGLGLCMKHYQRVKKHGDPFLVVKRLPGDAPGAKGHLVRVAD